MSKLFCYACLLALGAGGIFAQAVPPPVLETSGMAGLAFGETARLNVLNPTTVASCSAALAFLDASGAVLKTQTISVPAGKSVSFDLRSDSDLDLAMTDRREIRATLLIPGLVPVSTTPSAVAPCQYVKTLEIFDNASLRTLVVLDHFRDVTAPAVAEAP